jgi:superoxide reductase
MADSPLVTLVADFTVASDFEKKHTPFITLAPHGEGVLVNVEVGHEVPHPNGTDHYITCIELYAGMAPIARLDLSPVITSPKFCVPVDLPVGTVLRAVAHCNLHGWWAMEVTL